MAATARRQEELETLASEATGLAGRIVPFAGDVTDRARMAAIVAEIEDTHGPVALAILNAGVYLPVEAPDFSAEIFEKTFAINLMGTVYGLEPLLARMIARRSGHIAIVSSVTGYGGLPTSAAYGASKAALNVLAESLAIELDRHGVRLSLITPGFVETPAQDDNEFPKPFMVSSDEAAKRIVAGLKGQAFEITFPRRFTWWLWFLRIVPRNWYISLIQRQTGWDKPADGA